MNLLFYEFNFGSNFALDLIYTTMFPIAFGLLVMMTFTTISIKNHLGEEMTWYSSFILAFKYCQLTIIYCLRYLKSKVEKAFSQLLKRTNNIEFIDDTEQVIVTFYKNGPNRIVLNYQNITRVRKNGIDVTDELLPSIQYKQLYPNIERYQLDQS